MHMISVSIVLSGLVVYQIGRALYNLYWHPLAKYPGPKLWIAFPILRYISGMRGDLDAKIFEFHERYGEVVRYSDSEITFTTDQAWKDVYGHGRSLPKYDPREKGTHPDIIFSNNVDHTRFRKTISHAFSEKSLRLQEPIIDQHVALLMQGLQEEATADRKVDMTMWYNLTTFDIISDLAFGKSFGCLESKSYNEYIDAIFGFMENSPVIRFGINFPLIFQAVTLFSGGKIQAARQKLRQLTNKTAMQRAHDDEMIGRGDFMDSMLRHRGTKDGLSDSDIAANANILFIAGSETTATLLSGVSYWLLKTPEALRKVTEEVRNAFDREEDIDFMTATQKLPYMLACLEEALRRYPPVPGVFSRVTETTTDISGYTVPAGTLVGVHQVSAYWTERNFHRAKEYIPERWLSESTTDPSSPFYNDNRAVMQPFSFGPRNCIGRNLAYNEMRLILAKILWRFDLSLEDESSEWENQKTRVLWAKHPLFCKLRLRQEVAEK